MHHGIEPELDPRYSLRPGKLCVCESLAYRTGACRRPATAKDGLPCMQLLRDVRSSDWAMERQVEVSEICDICSLFAQRVIWMMRLSGCNWGLCVLFKIVCRRALSLAGANRFLGRLIRQWP